MSNVVYVVGAVLIILAWIFRVQLSKAGTFLTGSLHAFANEYNDAYAIDEENEDSKRSQKKED
jgi:hypothetical protein